MLGASCGGIETIDNAALHNAPQNSLPSTYDGGQHGLCRLIGGASASLSGHSEHFLLRPPKAVQSARGIAQKRPEAHKSAVSICSHLIPRRHRTHAQLD